MAPRRLHLPPSLSAGLWLALVGGCDGLGCGSGPFELGRDEIDELIRTESVVTYRDGRTRIGVFFEDEHRQTVGWTQLPVPFVVAIVAAEDGRFWSHRGVDARHVARAARDNVKAGRLVAGGSTLTQQAAKNLFERPDRSLGAKWEELDQALHLEKMYSKHEILTFYANQFHVTGNGRGLGIAARYFFSKSASELTLLEAAFIAGAVKGPANYDPFIGDTERQKKARARADARTRYVLQRIVDEPLDHLVPPPDDERSIRRAEVQAVRAEAARLLQDGFELPFHKGVFRFDTSVLLDEVASRLQTEPYKSVLAQAGLDDPETAGITVVTTLDEQIQRESAYGLWHHLTEVGVMMEGLDASAFVLEGESAPRADPFRPPIQHELRRARVSAHIDGKHLEADLGGHACVLDRDAMVRAAVAAHRGQTKSSRSKISTAAVDAFVAAIPDDAVVLVSVRQVPAEGAARCDLELRPELQGAAVVLEDGQLRAMVGGNDNRFFNRATAPRQMGSTFKPLIYHAAMTLGWRPEDLLDNRRQVFPFSGTFYVPRPDHTPAPTVSMAWAGVKSENIASIWLLYHLTDRLERRELHALAQELDLAQRPEETADDYKTRMQEAGVMSTPARVAESLYLKTRHEVIARLEERGEPDQARALRSLYYGWGFAQRLRRAKGVEREALGASWLAVEPLIEPCAAQAQQLQRALRRGQELDSEKLELLTARVQAAEAEEVEEVEEAGELVEPVLDVACGASPEGFVPLVEALAPDHGPGGT